MTPNIPNRSLGSDYCLLCRDELARQGTILDRLEASLLGKDGHISESIRTRVQILEGRMDDADSRSDISEEVAARQWTFKAQFIVALITGITVAAFTVGIQTLAHALGH